MREQIMDAVKTAMKSGDKRRLSTLRLIQAAIKDRDIAARVDAKGQSTGNDKIDDGELLQLLQKMIKQRRDSIKMYAEAGRTELAEQEQSEIEIIEEYLPKQMSEDEVAAAVGDVVKELGAAGLKDMGRTMAALKERYAGQMDFGKASGIVKANLT
ncbi:MAG: GatB/YqeY domain-containing protein [Hyphomicrobiaceae bacterium]